MKRSLPFIRIVLVIAILPLLACPVVSQSSLGSASANDDTPSNPLGKASAGGGAGNKSGGQPVSNKNKTGSKVKGSIKPNPINQAEQERKLLEQVDDFITKGNEARDAKPPRYDEAEAAYNSAVELAPKTAKEYAARANLGLGNIYFDQKRLTEALIKYNRVIELDPNNYDAHLYLSYTYNRFGNLDEAIKTLQRAIEINKEDFRAYRTLGGAYVRKSSYGEAEASYRRAIELVSGATNKCRLNFSLGYVLVKQKRYRDAASVFQTAETLAGNEIDWRLDARFNYIDCLVGSGQWKLAEKEFNTLAKQLDDTEKTSPDKIKTVNSIRVRLNYKLGLLYYLWNDVTQAREKWSAAINSKISCDLCGSGILILDNSYDRAQLILTRYTGVHAEDEIGWLLLYDVRLALKDEDGARLAFKEAFNLSPDFSRAWLPITERPKTPSKGNAPPTLKANNTIGSLVVETDPNALVTVVPTDGGKGYRGTASAEKGVKVFDNLPVGNYRVTSKLGDITAIREVIIAANRRAVIKLYPSKK